MKYTKEWQNYDHDYGYDKQEYDIQLKNGRVILNCYPNAGKFNSFNDYTKGEYQEKNIHHIRLSENPVLDINV